MCPGGPSRNHGHGANDQQAPPLAVILFVHQDRRGLVMAIFIESHDGTSQNRVNFQAFRLRAQQIITQPA